MPRAVNRHGPDGSFEMPPNRLARSLLLLAAIAVLAVVVTDLMQFMRPSALAAVACTGELVRRRPDARSLIVRYHDTISSQAARYDLPPELVAAVIVNHQAYLSTFRRFTDCFGSALGANLSVGLAQLRLSTVALTDGTPLTDLSASEFRALRKRLLQPEQNIAYEARELRALLERRNRYPGMGAEALIRDPFVMALLITEYRMGRMSTASDKSRLSANAFNALQLIADDTLDRFERDANDRQRIRSAIRNYLHTVYCESGIFNASMCREWRQSQSGA